MTDLPRPRQVTTAGVMGVAGSVLVILSLFDTLSSLNTVDVREQVDEFLATPQGRGLGVDAAWVLDALHVMVLVNGALAAIAAVLGVFVFQRHQGARIGFTISAALLFVGMWVVADLVQGVLIGVVVVVAFAASMMWSPPARDWFAGRAPAPLPERGRPDTVDRDRPAPPASAWPPPAGRDVPSGTGDEGRAGPPGPSSYPFGQQRPAGTEQSWTSEAPPAPAPYGGAPAPATSERRPGPVTAAVVITWLFAGLVGSMFGLLVLMLIVAQDTLLEAARQSPGIEELGLTTSDLLAAFWVSGALVLFWCLAAMVLALLAFRRVSWAWGLLVASSVMTVLFSLLTIPPGLVVGVPAAVCVGLLLTGRSRRWFTQRHDAWPPQGPPGPPEQAGPAYPGPQPQEQHPAPPPPPSGKPPVW